MLIIAREHYPQVILCSYQKKVQVLISRLGSLKLSLDKSQQKDYWFFLNKFVRKSCPQLSQTFGQQNLPNFKGLICSGPQSRAFIIPKRGSIIPLTGFCFPILGSWSFICIFARTAITLWRQLESIFQRRLFGQVDLYFESFFILRQLPSKKFMKN